MKKELKRISTDFGIEDREYQQLLKLGFCVERKQDEYGYLTYITIDSLEELLKLEKYADGYLVITPDHIEIYDDYRE